MAQKDLFTENLKRGLYKKAPLTQYVRCGCHDEAQFIENAKRDWYRISFFYTQYVRRDWHEKPLFIESARRG